MPTTTDILRTAAWVLVPLMLASTLTACSSSNVTCQDYGKMTGSEREDYRSSLLRKHKLKELDPSNVIGLNNSVNSLCGTSMRSGATRNLEMPIEEAIDWKSKNW